LLKQFIHGYGVQNLLKSVKELPKLLTEVYWHVFMDHNVHV